MVIMNTPCALISDLDLAWKMLLIAKAILVNTPCCPLEKLEIFSTLAEVSMERGQFCYLLYPCS
jgi:hypothetical protein